MTVWASSVVIEFNGQRTTADAGTFQAVTPHGRLPVNTMPEIGTYPITTLGGGAGGTIGGQSGSVSIF